tara:strand:+ start:198 stop:542 length:345 start_codon:yes stop_codon:yes gene_type:complete
MHATIRVSLSWLNVVIVLQGSRLPHDPAPENSSPKKATLSRDAKIRAGKIRRLPEMRVNCTCTLKKERKERKKRKEGEWVYLSNLSWNHSIVIEMPIISAARTSSIRGSCLNII